MNRVSKIGFLLLIVLVLPMAVVAQTVGDVAAIVRPCTVYGEMQLLVMSPASGQDHAGQGAATLKTPTRPAGEVRSYWDTPAGTEGSGVQALFLLSGGGSGSATQFGRQGYHPVELDGQPVQVMAFQQSGERWTFAIDGTIYVDDGGVAVPIGRVEFRTYQLTSGEQRRATMTQTAGEEGVWWFQADGRIYRQDPDGSVAQVGWIEWRIVSSSSGENLAIMTKGMGQNDPWSCRLEGVRYAEAR